jgi:acetylglutamate kinase
MPTIRTTATGWQRGTMSRHDLRRLARVGGALIPSLTTASASQLREAGVLSGGMIPKVACALDAVAAGVRKAHIIDGRTEHAVLLEIFTDLGIGTEFTA